MDSAARAPENPSGVEDRPERKDTKRKAISSPYFHRLQRKHFLLFDVLPVAGVVLAIALAFYRPVSAVDIGLFIAFWALTGIGISVGYHRYFTHRAFKAKPMVGVLLTVLGSMAGQGALLSWVAMHRRHHELSDQPGDPHSPNLLPQTRRLSKIYRWPGCTGRTGYQGGGVRPRAFRVPQQAAQPCEDLVLGTQRLLPVAQAHRLSGSPEFA